MNPCVRSSTRPNPRLRLRRILSILRTSSVLLCVQCIELSVRTRTRVNPRVRVCTRVNPRVRACTRANPRIRASTRPNPRLRLWRILFILRTSSVHLCAKCIELSVRTRTRVNPRARACTRMYPRVPARTRVYPREPARTRTNPRVRA